MLTAGNVMLAAVFLKALTTELKFSFWGKKLRTQGICIGDTHLHRSS
jgi:hypothetical protein